MPIKTPYKIGLLPGYRGIEDFRAFLTFIGDFFSGFSGDAAVKRVVHEIGPWNMFTGGGPNVTQIDIGTLYGIELGALIDARVIIYSDDGATVGTWVGWRGNMADALQGGTGSPYITAPSLGANHQVWIASSKVGDTNYQNVTGNRGYVVLEHI